MGNQVIKKGSGDKWDPIPNDSVAISTLGDWSRESIIKGKNRLFWESCRNVVRAIWFFVVKPNVYVPP